MKYKSLWYRRAWGKLINLPEVPTTLVMTLLRTTLKMPWKSTHECMLFCMNITKVENHLYYNIYIYTKSPHHPSIYTQIPTAMRLLHKEAKNHHNLKYWPQWTTYRIRILAHILPNLIPLNFHNCKVETPIWSMLARFSPLAKSMINDNLTQLSR